MTKELVVIGDGNIGDKIVTVRGLHVMLDSDLAVLYGVETGNLNKAAGRNAARFPEDFRFQLTQDEWDVLLFQIGSAKSGGRGGRRSLPFVYTKSGVAMLSAVLKSLTAVSVSVAIMDAFVRMRHFVSSNAALLRRMTVLEDRQLCQEERLNQVFAKIDDASVFQQKIFFDGQIWDAHILFVRLLKQAKKKIVLVDGYVSVETLDLLSHKNNGVEVFVWTKPSGKVTQTDIDRFNAQNPSVQLKYTQAFHDRFLILDDKHCYHIGASIKDAGKKTFAINLFEDKEIVRDILARLDRERSLRS